MNIGTYRATVVALALVPASAHAEGSAAAGALKIKTSGCIACHGRDGVSKLPEAPNLAGQVAPYIVSSLKAYHAAERKNEIMNTVAQNLSDQDMADLAAYYSGIKITVTPPPKP
jgi:cytochrome c553